MPLLVRIDESLELVLACADQCVDLLAVLEHLEGWHRRDVILLGNFRSCVDVDLDECLKMFRAEARAVRKRESTTGPRYELV